MTTPAWDLLVARNDLHRTAITPVAQADPAEGEVLFRVASVSQTANNIT